MQPLFQMEISLELGVKTSFKIVFKILMFSSSTQVIQTKQQLMVSTINTLKIYSHLIYCWGENNSVFISCVM